MNLKIKGEVKLCKEDVLKVLKVFDEYNYNNNSCKIQCLQYQPHYGIICNRKAPRQLATILRLTQLRRFCLSFRLGMIMQSKLD